MKKNVLLNLKNATAWKRILLNGQKKIKSKEVLQVVLGILH